MARDQLRFEEIGEILRGAQASRQHGLVGTRRAVLLAVPALHELDEVRIADFGAVDVLVAGRNRVRNGGHVSVQAISRDCSISATFSAAYAAIGTNPG